MKHGHSKNGVQSLRSRLAEILFFVGHLRGVPLIVSDTLTVKFDRPDRTLFRSAGATQAAPALPPVRAPSSYTKRTAGCTKRFRRLLLVSLGDQGRHFKKVVHIPVSAYHPPASSELTRAPDPLPPDCYVKKPRLISYDRIRRGSRPDLIAEFVLAEAKVCEQLMRHPHPNFATYLGFQVSDGRITGRCFARYQRTLMQEVNPRNFSKRKSRSARRATGRYDYVPAGMESGIKHIHSLGLVHNDINPKNVMLDGNRVVLIDFDSCRPLSAPKNDLDALVEIRAWLGDDSATFQFNK
ncbi:hypothetical protein B0T25DRAFT_610305 [Lasiosphaeria hispida]|uniref:Protein kinase domain-containing protein n=1 Tax=Lasiosphaeria hispida TaxID=260671 RepID=A0AAJ0HFB7_9PEZI|nr:hypothetical protein B0T25DRAFT_610305 [Lasiosphaeria hispida]